MKKPKRLPKRPAKLFAKLSEIGSIVEKLLPNPTTVTIDSDCHPAIRPIIKDLIQVGFKHGDRIDITDVRFANMEDTLEQ